MTALAGCRATILITFTRYCSVMIERITVGTDRAVLNNQIQALPGPRNTSQSEEHDVGDQWWKIRDNALISTDSSQPNAMSYY